MTGTVDPARGSALLCVLHQISQGSLASRVDRLPRGTEDIRDHRVRIGRDGEPSGWQEDELAGLADLQEAGVPASVDTLTRAHTHTHRRRTPP